MTPNNTLSDWPAAAGNSARRSVLASDLIIEGDVTSDGPVDVQGRLQGSVRAPDVVVAGSAPILGSAPGGDLFLCRPVFLTPLARKNPHPTTAVVHADVLHEQIAIEAGAELEGRLQRKA